MTSVNIWPILVASVVAFGIGALWYSPILFGKEWLALVKMTDKDVAATKARGIWKYYVVQIIFTIVTFSVLGFAVSATGSITAADGAFLGLLAWVGFILPIGVSMISWERRPMKLVLINTICMLLTFVVGGAIIGAWR